MAPERRSNELITDNTCVLRPLITLLPPVDKEKWIACEGGSLHLPELTLNQMKGLTQDKPSWYPNLLHKAPLLSIGSAVSFLFPFPLFIMVIVIMPEHSLQDLTQLWELSKRNISTSGALFFEVWQNYNRTAGKMFIGWELFVCINIRVSVDWPLASCGHDIYSQLTLTTGSVKIWTHGEVNTVNKATQIEHVICQSCFN